jgi:hypothetical protein
MKDVFIGLILTLLLIAFFSSIYTPFEPVSSVGYGDKKPGDSGMVLPGKGSKPAEIMSESPQNKTAEKTDSFVVTSEEPTEESEEIHTETIKEEQNKVDGLMLAFWHGVAAVLIGEASALLVAFAWTKIRGGKDG